MIMMATRKDDVSRSPSRPPCLGITMLFPPGKSQHTLYLFGLHSEFSIPWDYHSIGDKFVFQAKSCLKRVAEPGKVYSPCHSLLSNSLYEGIIEHMEHGVHENSPLAYHPIGGLVTIARRKMDQIQQLCFAKFNDTCKLVGKAAMLEDHKQ
jgi:hypothetical protein